MVKKDNQKPRYHHGDLKTALLAAAELELETAGIEKFSLRGVARAAQVSHAAPAHHFGDTTGLLTELAAIGFERFLQAQLKGQARASSEPLEQLTAAGVAYVDFANRYPQLFQLMFTSKRPDRTHHRFVQTSSAAFDHLVSLVNAVTGTDAHIDSNSMADVHAVWGIVHGISTLINADFMKRIGDTKKQREDAVHAIVKRYWQNDKIISG